MADDTITITPYDGPTADESTIRLAYELLLAEDAELRPTDAPFSWVEFHGIQRAAVEHERRLHWIVTDADRQPLARAELKLPVAHNTHLAVVLLYVHPHHRRRGIGTRVLRELLRVMEADGRTDVVTDINEGHVGEAFFRRFGGVLGLPQRISRLDLRDLDRGLVARWLADGDAADGYSLVEWRRRCPDEFVDSYVVVKAAMNGAPVDDLPIADRVHTVESVRENEAELEAAELEKWTIAARHDATGDLAGFTEVIFIPGAPEHAWQGGTGVLPEHRGHRLGRWMKAAMADRILSERPAVRYVDTENAYSNGPMLAINVEMGFEILRTVNGWKADVAALSNALG
jgi:mycothiol synthase